MTIRSHRRRTPRGAVKLAFAQATGYVTLGRGRTSGGMIFGFFCATASEFSLLLIIAPLFAATDYEFSRIAISSRAAIGRWSERVSSLRR